jgi:hypothetical protein
MIYFMRQNEMRPIKEDKELIISFFKHKELECYHFFN